VWVLSYAFAYIHNRTLRELLRRRAIRHIRTRPYTPRTNGKVERYQQTLQREWAYALEYASSDARRASLPHWVRHYNERRIHSAAPARTRSGRHRAQQLAPGVRRPVLGSSRRG
jgi:transposase InsO family protein